MNEFEAARLRYERKHGSIPPVIKTRRLIVEDTQLVATDPHQMAQAQHSMVEFCDAKLAGLQTELASAHGIIEALRKANMSDARGRRLVTGIKKREAFYTKVKAALAEGYYILPPIPHQTFAIRSAKPLPPPNRQTGNTWRADEPTPPVLPVGEGENHSATVERQVVDTFDTKDKQGNAVTKYVYGNVAWKDVEFPFFPVKPQIIEATGRALERKIFDWLGVAPSYRSVDPMVIGCIKHWKPNAGPLHFFVAWWLDTDTL
jgi:hypothetical protein